MGLTLRRERVDALHWLACAAIVVAIWWGRLALSRGQLAGGGDSSLYLFCVDRLTHAFGDWTRAGYSTDVLGGVGVVGVYGSPLPLRVGAAIGLQPVDSYFLGVVVTQSLFAFLGTRATLAVSSLLQRLRGSRAYDLPMARWLFLPVAFAFLPTFGWRYGIGHEIFLCGLLPFFAMVTLVLVGLERSTTLVLGAASVLAISQGLASHGYQLELYSVVFGTPVVLGLLALERDGRRRLMVAAVSAVPALLALLTTGPLLRIMLAYATSTDSLRAVGDDLVYSYTVGNLRDWVGSIFWSAGVVPSSYGPDFVHETHYALGPTLVMLRLVPWSRARLLALAMMWAGFGAVLFSCNVAPLSTLLVHIPLMSTLRVPERAILPFAALLPIFTLGALLSRAGSRRTALASALAFVAALFSNARVVEAGAWLFALASSNVRLLRLRGLSVISLAVVAGGSIDAFGESLPPLASADDITGRPTRLGARVREMRPELGAPLVRTLVRDSSAQINNEPYFMGLSSIEGFAVPTRRFLELARAAGSKFGPLQYSIRFELDGPAIAILGPLYNVRAVAHVTGESVDIVDRDDAVGAAWFPRRVTLLGDAASLIGRLRARPEAIRGEAWVVASDPVVSARDISTLSGQCDRATVAKLDASDRSNVLVVTTEVPSGPCLLVLSTNYMELLHARECAPASVCTPAESLPVYGALLGVVVHANTTRVEISTAQ